MALIDDDIIASVSYKEDVVTFYHLFSGEEVGRIECPVESSSRGEGQFSVFRVDEETIAVGEWSYKGRIYFLNVLTRECVRILTASHGHYLWRMCFAPHSEVCPYRRLVAVDQAGYLAVYDASSERANDPTGWKCLGQMKDNQNQWLHGVCALSDKGDALVATGGGLGDTLPRIWDIEKMANVSVLHKKQSTITDMAYSPQYQLLMAHGASLICYDVRADEAIAAGSATPSSVAMRSTTGFVDDAHFSLVYGSGDGTVSQLDLRKVDSGPVHSFAPFASCQKSTGTIYSLLPHPFDCSLLLRQGAMPTFIASLNSGAVAQFRIDGKALRDPFTTGEHRLLSVLAMGEEAGGRQALLARPGGWLGGVDVDLLERVGYLFQEVMMSDVDGDVSRLGGGSVEVLAAVDDGALLVRIPKWLL